MTAADIERIRRAQSRGGQMGAAKRWLLFDPVPDAIVPAQQAYRASFRSAHGGDPAAYASIRKRDRPVGLCRWCPDRVEVPAGATEKKRDEYARYLMGRHFSALSAKAVAARRASG
jgi:hypothetical protein